MDFITNLWLTFNAYSKANPMVAGAVSLWGLSVVTWLCRKMPATIWSKIRSQVTTSLEFDNTEVGWTQENYAGFMVWFMKNGWSKYSRAHSLQSFGMAIAQRRWAREGGNAAEITLGSGHHYFFYKRRLFVLKREHVPQTGNSNLIYKIHLTMFGRNKQVIRDLVDEFCYKFDPTKQNILHYKQYGWEVYGSLDRRELSTVIIDEMLKRQIVEAIEDWRKNPTRWTSRGLPYKLTIILHGVPGTGKTSLIKAIASHFTLDICQLSLTSMTDDSLAHALAMLPKNSLLAVEDFDSSKATHARKNLKHGVDKTVVVKDKEDKGTEAVFGDLLTLSGILNAFDGIASLHGSLIFLSTNALDQIDPALLRKGRIDRIFELKALTHKEVVTYIQLMFPNEPIPNVKFMDILGCDLQAAFLEHPYDYQQFIAALPAESSYVQQLVQAA